jgi:hypothetical protein
MICPLVGQEVLQNSTGDAVVIRRRGVVPIIVRKNNIFPTNFVDFIKIFFIIFLQSHFTDVKWDRIFFLFPAKYYLRNLRELYF